MWIRNCWYVVAWDHEIPKDGLFARTVLNEPIVLFRTASGFAALEDRCCHRHAPLSVGRKEGDAVRCGYHGLKFAADGRCVEVPGMDRPPGAAKVRSYPVVEKNKWVFVWMGDAQAADENMLPDNFSNGSDEWKNIPGYMHYDTPYLLICDNLLDFSHLSYVHEKSLGGSTEIALARPDIEEVNADGQRGLRVSRRVNDVPPPPFYQRFRSFEGNLDRWFIYDFLLPGTLLMHSGGRPTGSPQDDNSAAVRLHSCQTLTPETDTSTHYFFQQGHPASEGDDTVAESIYNSVVGAFHEDRDMITAQLGVINRDPTRPMLPLHMDRALLRFREIVAEQVDKEGGAY
ncbi:MAG: aromatic ring-hydroxylating dioxygenase subunit alpha [Chromatiales bacterium]|nr:aromatic ring-hydroxylating dioxygenase subunit alpha [Chromatiales bacterium]